MVETKKCNKCKEDKDLFEYHKDKSSADKLQNKCKKCCKEYYKNNKEKINKQKRQYREDNKEKINKQKRQYREDNKEKIKEQKKKHYKDNKEKVNEHCKQYYEDNKEKFSKYGKRYYEDNKEKISERNKQYQKDNKKEIDKYNKQWKKDNPEKVKEAGKKHRENNKEKISERNKQWKKDNPEKVKECRRTRRALERAVNENYTAEDEIYTLQLFNHKCFNCGSVNNLCIDHHRALSKGYALSLDNAVILCGPCNSSKGPKDPEEFYGKEKCMELDERLKKVAENNQMTNYNNLSNEQLIKIVENLERQKKYGLVYKEHKEDIIKKCASHIPVFEEIRDRAVVGGGVNHVLIEGDNYPSLLTLQGAYKNKINIIYLDPPYNTGNKDFIYNDNLVDKEDMYRHSKWLSFMEPRLELARELLSDDGVIFISIDDNEQAQLKLLCDEVFGESNFVASVPRLAKMSSNKGTFYSPSKDYILVYKSSQRIKEFYDILDEKYISKFNKSDDYGKYSTVGLYQASLDNRPNQRYFIECPDNSFAIPPGLTMPKTIKDASFIKPETEKDKVWRWAYTSYLEKKYLLVFKKTKKSPLLDQNGNQSKWNIYTKYYLEDRKKDGKRPRDWLDGFQNTTGSNELKNLGIDFNYPKPVGLIKYLIQISNQNKNSIILDFFAGSGTTFQAVAELNKEDGGQRKCILITNNENKICENITYQRCKKVIEGYTTPKGKIVEGTKQNLRYFRTNFVEAGQDQAQIRANLKANIAPMICMENDGYNLLKKDIGYEVYTNDDLTIAILISNTPKYIKSLKNILKDIKGPIKVYQALSTGGVETDLKQQLQNKNIEVYSSVDDYVKIYQHSTYKLRLEQNDE